MDAKSTPQFKRVILLTTDATSAELITEQSAPQISSLFRSGIYCARAYAHGNPTQFSFPTIMTSSLPLDFGGYDWGVRHRPVTLAEVMRRAGYATYDFSTTVWLSSLFGYSRGFDQLFAFHNPVASWNGSLSLYLTYWKRLVDSRVISRDEYFRQLELLLSAWFLYLGAHCDGDVARAGELPVTDHDQFGWQNQMRGVRDRLSAEYDRFLKDPHQYVAKRGDRLSQDDVRTFLRLPSVKGNSRYVSAKLIFNSILNVLRQDIDRPVFVWAHFRDVHDYDSLPQVSQKSTLRRTRQRAVTFWDRHLQRFMEILRHEMLDENCLLGVFSDHGSGPACSLGDTSLEVPLVFWARHSEPCTVTAPCGLWDLAPTVLDLNGLPPEPSFQGVSVLSLEGKQDRMLVAEHTGRGPCDLPRKRINLAVTNGQHKIVFRENAEEGPLAPHFDLNAELNRPIPNSTHSDFVEVFQQRCKHLRSQLSV